MIGQRREQQPRWGDGAGGRFYSFSRDRRPKMIQMAVRALGPRLQLSTSQAEKTGHWASPLPLSIESREGAYRVVETTKP